MQPECCRSSTLFRIPRVLAGFRETTRFCVIAVLFLMIGCGPMPTTIDPIPAKPHQGKSLRVAYASSISHPELLQQFAQDWADRSGAEVKIEGPQSEKTISDIIVIAPAELSQLVESGAIQPVPSEFLPQAHPYHWESLFPMYSRIISSWEKGIYGIPLLGDSRVLVYRSDRFEQAKLNVPRTWEEFIAVAPVIVRVGVVAPL